MENRRSVPPQLPPRIQAKTPTTPQRDIVWSIDTKQGAPRADLRPGIKENDPGLYSANRCSVRSGIVAWHGW